MRLVHALHAATACAVLLASACSSGGGSGTTTPPDTTAPTVPGGVSASKTGPQQITVGWLASTDTGTGVAGYNVYRNGAATAAASVSAGTLTYVDSGLNANTDYSYTVSAFDRAMPPNQSAKSTASPTVRTDPATDTIAPSIPQNLNASALTSSSVQLTWQASTDNAGGSGLAGYRVFRSGTQIAQVAAGILTYTDSGLAASTPYSYTVRAYDNAANESGDSNAAVATTLLTAGMTARPSNTTCVAPQRPNTGGGSVALSVQRVFPNLTFGNGNGVSGAFQAPGNSSYWYVTELDGHIRKFANNNSTPASSVTTFLDMTALNTSTPRVAYGGELGFFGIAFHPNFPTDPRVFVSYTTYQITGSLQSVISQFSSTDGGATINPSTEKVLVTVNQLDQNHKGGFIGFGHDGMLYFGLGDGGNEGDPHGFGQDTRTLRGKIMRIDVSNTSGAVPYLIPGANPFSGNAACNKDTGTSTTSCPEIYAWGLRNPWKASFDRQSGQLWAGDVGQNLWEEVDRVDVGGNYGWRCREGAHNYLFDATCAATPNLLDPVAEYAHAGSSNAVTGGYVYRGSSIPGLVGQYVFADFYRGLFTVDGAASPTVTVANPTSLSGFGILVAAFAEDHSGELLVVDYNGGLYQLTGSGGGGTNTIPDTLSATGCVSASNATQPATGLIPYAPNASFWSDGAAKRRWIGLPNGAQIDTSAASGDWVFPPGTVLVKEFSLNNQRIETRLLMRHPDGVWAGYVYQWNAAQTDATRVSAGVDVTVAGQVQPWHIPSETECMSCHTSAATFSLGLETAQQNSNYAYPSAPNPPFTGSTANQLFTLNSIGLFNPAISAAPASLPAYPDPFAAAGTLDQRARAYLHINCSQCHRPGGGTPVDLDLRYQTLMAATNTCNVAAVDDLGVSGARRIAPGDPGGSVLYQRMNQRGAKQMPPIATNIVDTAGAALLDSWIAAMSANCQ